MNTPAAITKVISNLSDNYELAFHGEQGGNGYIFKGKNIILNQEVMLKFYDWSDQHRAHQEPLTMKDIEHPNVLRVLHAGFGDSDWAYFVTPYMKDGTLDRFIDKREFPLREGASLIIKICAGVCALHGRHILHRDLKPANIFIDNNKPVVGNFGSNLYIEDLSDTVASKSKHSMIYRPPESISSQIFSVKSDVYQLGIVLYQLLGGYLPYAEAAWLSDKETAQYGSLSFPDNTIFADQCICNRILKGKVIDLSTLKSYVPTSLKRIIKKCCALDPNKRYMTVSELIVAVNNILPSLFDWRIGNDENYYLTNGAIQVCLSAKKAGFQVKQRRMGGEWRNKHKYEAIGDLRTLIDAIEADS